MLNEFVLVGYSVCIDQCVLILQRKINKTKHIYYTYTHTHIHMNFLFDFFFANKLIKF